MALYRSLLAACCLATFSFAAPLLDLSVNIHVGSGGIDKVRGVNLGGWLVLEPWITPTLFDKTGNPDIVDEYTFGKLQDPDVALDALKEHWDTWITEQDFIDIANAGLNTVRVPIGYWAFEVSNGEPYIQGQIPYLRKALEWGNAHGLQVIIDLHGAPESQNGYDNSGQRRNAPGWHLNQTNIDRTTAVVARIANEFDAPIYAPLNEPAGYIDGVLEPTLQYWKDAYAVIRNSSHSEAKVLIHDAFQNLTSLQRFMTPPEFQNVAMDKHIYQVFSDAENQRSEEEHIQFACNLTEQLSTFDLELYVGEWAPAKTDCAKYLNGRGKGARYDGTFEGSSKIGSCEGLTGSANTFSEDYKTFLRKYWEVQTITYEKADGWIQWTWKAENADEWSYQAGLANGWIPKNPTDPASQGHLFKFWPQLSESERKSLLDQLDALDIERVNRIYQKALSAEAETNDPKGPPVSIEPLPKGASESIKDEAKQKEWRKIGLEAVSRGEVGVLLMAGGQGTRLGSSAPKGCYDIGLPSHKSLFQYQAERIARLQTVAEKEFGKATGSVIIPWYVMTSGPTRRDTEDFFSKHSHFGLDPKNVIFFEQGTLPCLTMEGKVILDAPSKVAVAPDGNGGLYAATRAPLSPSDKSHTVLSDLSRRKILYVHAYCVDNCLVRVADPAFLGYSISKQADCAAKVVPKSHPTESVGVVALRGGKYSVVEYSEITKEQAERRDPETGELMFRAGNIANHFYTTAYLNQVEKFEGEMAFHIARKKIPHVDLESGASVKPTKPNGMKLELFVFDVFPYTERFAVLEVERREEFSPLKNAPGTGADDPETSRRDLLAQHKRFLENAGAIVKDGVEIELSPLVSYDGEGLENVRGKSFSKSGMVGSLEELDALV
ncbi:hypothetical protein D9758_002201 [Tetrapyrgos nigripes]|uniref:UDP-N-acetylglucosamine diphosphorylase n=1 Tax=Tetrapyrgos nigripes TaxID=182062 RepID=A0A8H5GPI0_9AGAR|nr:hypothetical protein D9758_002201 [Tetrapyrgos nigripes]